MKAHTSIYALCFASLRDSPVGRDWPTASSANVNYRKLDVKREFILQPIDNL